MAGGFRTGPSGDVDWSSREATKGAGTAPGFRAWWQPGACQGFTSSLRVLDTLPADQRLDLAPKRRLSRGPKGRSEPLDSRRASAPSLVHPGGYSASPLGCLLATRIARLREAQSTPT